MQTVSCELNTFVSSNKLGSSMKAESESFGQINYILIGIMLFNDVNNTLAIITIKCMLFLLIIYSFAFSTG